MLEFWEKKKPQPLDDIHQNKKRKRERILPEVRGRGLSKPLKRSRGVREVKVKDMRSFTLTGSF